MDFKSDISGAVFPQHEKVSAALLRKPLLDLIRQDKPEFDEKCSLAMTELSAYREKYMSTFLKKELGELNEMEQKVVKSLQDKSLLADNPDDSDDSLAIGQRIADKVASFGGSWTFILSFLTFLLGWIAINVFILANKGFDPYPFILLNLLLSCIAALQAPVIMMSQNRQGEKDREKAQNDYMINLKSELEIRMLHEKIDHIILHQEQSLIEIQRIQIDMMNDILAKLEKN
jgi:uncharacterized membrane protein